MLSKEAENYINHRGLNEGRVVLHSDLNNFFASVECLKHKSLKKYPVAVCGSSEERHGIVLAKNNIAKKYGIKTGQVIWEAKRMCPDLIILEPNYDEYLYYSGVVREIYSKYSDRVEPFGMDEAWIELTGCKGVKTLYDGVSKANEIRKNIYEETGLTVSIGVSDNKTFSKLASDYKKPDAVTVLGPEEYVDKISKLGIGEMMFAGRMVQKRLRSFYIETIGDAAQKNISLFKNLLGKNGERLYMSACGYDLSGVSKCDEQSVIKSIGNSVTPPRNISGENDVRLMMYALSDKVCSRLRKAGLKGTVVQIHIRDKELNVFERQGIVDITDNDMCVALKAMELYNENFKENMEIRSMGVRVSGLIKEGACYQSSFMNFSEEIRERNGQIDVMIDALRNKFGGSIIKRGILCTDKTLYSPLYAEKQLIQPFKMH